MNPDAGNLVQIIEKRFKDVVEDEDSIYLASGVLDPREATEILTEKQIQAFQSVSKLVNFK